MSDVLKYVLTGVGFGPSILPVNQQAKYLELITFKSMMRQSSTGAAEWIIAADLKLSEQDTAIVDRVAVNSGSKLIWVNGNEQTWGELLMSVWVWEEECPQHLLTIGLPSGGALTTKYIETVDEVMTDRVSGWLSYSGGVVQGKNGKHGYTKNRYNYFSSRKERFGNGRVPLTCFLDEDKHDKKAMAPQHMIRDSKAAWMAVTGSNVTGQDEVDLSQFGLE